MLRSNMKMVPIACVAALLCAIPEERGKTMGAL